MRINICVRRAFAGGVLLAVLWNPETLAGQEDLCTVSILNQAGTVREDGTWLITNVPSNMGPVRARVTCLRNGETIVGTSDYFTITPNRMNAIPAVELGVFAGQPMRLDVSAPSSVLTQDARTEQLTVIAFFADGSSADVTLATQGTVYQSTNPGVATVDANGFVSGVASGRVLLSVLNEAVIKTVGITVSLSGDADGDGLPDDFEVANGLDANNPADAMEDADEDGLSNLDEFNLGTNLALADTDGDGIEDGEEAQAGEDGFVTNPLLADSDGDGISDSLEIQVGTNPNDGGDFNLAAVLEGIMVEPTSFTLVTNSIILTETSRRLEVTGRLIDGTFADLTAGRGTSYQSSNLSVANFGDEEGRVFAGAAGNAAITVSNGGFSKTVTVTVINFTPTALSFRSIPGHANGIAVRGGHAFVASGATGLTVVDVSNPQMPVIVGSVNTPGNGNDVRVVGNTVYLADGSAGVQIIDVTNPSMPMILGTVDTPGTATDLAVSSAMIYVADGSSGLQVIDASIPTMPFLAGAVDTPGNARGVDVEGSLVVVADGTGGIQVIDVSVPASPEIRGSAHTRSNNSSRAADVVIRQGLAYVADGADTSLGGLKVVDFTDPAAPFLAGGTNDQFGLSGVALDRSLALASDFFFVNAVPIFGVATTTPAVLGNLDFSGSPSSRDDNGTAIAIQDGLVFLTGSRSSLEDNGTSGDTGLHIGRYALLSDEGDIAPTVTIVSPTPGQMIPERNALTVQVDARDDILVQSVTFAVDGVEVFTDFAPPFAYTFQAPTALGDLRLGASALDLAGNQGVAREVTVLVIADDSPSVLLTSPAAGTEVTEGATILVTATASDDVGISFVEFLRDGVVVATDTTAPYQASVFVPVDATAITLQARATDTGGNDSLSQDVHLVVLPDQPPAVLVIEPVDGEEVIEGATISIVAGAVDDVGVSSVRFFIDGVQRAQDLTEPFQFNHLVPLAIQEFRIFAIARDTLGQETSSPEIRITVLPDPGTTVVGTVVLPDGAGPAVGATVRALEAMGLTDGQGAFSLPGVRTAPGPITVTASLLSAEGPLRGASSATFPVAEGITDVGTIVLQPQNALVASYPNALSRLDVEAGEVTSTLVLNNGVLDIAVGPGGNQGLLASYESSLLSFLDLTGEPITVTDTIAFGYPVDVEVTSNNVGLAASGYCGFGVENLVSLDMQNHSVIDEVTLPDICFPSLAVTSTGNLAVLCDFYSFQEIQAVPILQDGSFGDVQSVPLPVNFYALHVTVAPDDSIALVSGYDAFTGQRAVVVAEIDQQNMITVTQTLVLTTDAGKFFFFEAGSAFSPDGAKAYVFEEVLDPNAVFGVRSQLAILDVLGNTVADSNRRIDFGGLALNGSYCVDQMDIGPGGIGLAHLSGYDDQGFFLGGLVAVFDTASDALVGNISLTVQDDFGCGGIVSLR